MLSYYLKWRKNTESNNPNVVKTKKRKRILLLKCAVCDSKKLKSIRKQEPSELSSSLGITTILSEIP